MKPDGFYEAISNPAEPQPEFKYTKEDMDRAIDKLENRIKALNAENDELQVKVFAVRVAERKSRLFTISAVTISFFAI